jgi:hypothetical protein
MRGFSSWGFPRDTIVLGLARDLALPAQDSLVFLDDSYIVNERFEQGSLWSNVWFYRLYGGRIWRTRPLAAEPSFGYDEATELRSIENTQEHGAFLSQDIRRRSNGVAALRYATIIERDAAVGARPGLVGSHFRAADFVLTGRGKGWGSYRFTPRCAQLPTSALADDSPSLAVLEYGNGFSVPEQDGSGPFRWAARSSSLTLRNSSTAAAVTYLAVTVQTAGRARGALVVTLAGRHVAEIALSSTAAKLKTTIRIPAGSSVVLAMTANAPNVALPGDRRDVRVKFRDASLADATGCAVADAKSR